MEKNSEYLTIFNEEAGDLLREWEECLLALDADPRQPEPLNGMFRAIHTLKGSAGFIGFDTLQRLAHCLESSLADVRDGRRAYDAALGEVLFEGLDLCKSIIGSPDGDANYRGETDALLGRLSAQAGGEKPVRGPTAVLPAAPASAPAQDIRGVREYPFGEYPVPRRATPLTPRQLEVRIEGQPREAYMRSFLVKARLERLGTLVASEPSPEILREADGPFIYTVTVQSLASAEELADAVVIDQVTVCPLEAGEQGPVDTAPMAPAAAKEPGRDLAVTQPDEVVRVSVEKLDTLLNLVGELVIHNSGFVATAQSLRQAYGRGPLVAELEEKTEGLTAIARQLQNGIMKARMLPVARVFDRFRRVVRDLSKASGKTVVLEVSGEETEIDKKVIDRIGEPLVHLVRNAVDHGLETAAERAACGKSPAGTVRLAAYQEGDHICIQVSDDGRGLDREAIMKKALQKGLISRDEAETAGTERILGFIFLPGFSTAREVTDISGRGVGMDAVKRSVEEMGGNVRVQSVPGKGTVVTITLPLTMAIITAALVEASGSVYAIPLSAVREILDANASILRTVGGRPVIMLRNEVLVLVDLATVLGGGRTSARPAGSRHPVVIVEFEGTKIGLEVGKIIGTREVVIKSLSRHYREVGGLIGASILGSGTIALIVDVQFLIGQHSHRTNVVHPAPGVFDSPAENATATITAPALPASLEGPAEDLAAAITGSRGGQLEDLHNAAAIQASVSLSQLMGQEIRVSFPESRLMPLTDVSELIGGEEVTVGGIYVGIGGDLSGGVLLVFPEKNLLSVDDMLHGRPAGTRTDLADVDFSGLSEMGNILAACFINSIADAAGLQVSPEVPEISIDMCLPVIDSVLARFNQPGDKILLTEAVIYGADMHTVVCHQLLFLEPDSFRRLLHELAVDHGAALAMARA